MTYTSKTNGRAYRYELIGSSYNCPALKIYGEATPRHLFNSIERKLRKAR
jgi:hypothetical protein